MASDASAMPAAAGMELEHAIGFTAIRGTVHAHPQGDKYYFVTGGCIVVGSTTNPHDQTFVRGHDDDITCLKLSASGRFLVTGQRGHNADVVFWDATTLRPIYRMHEHEHAVVATNISLDDTLFSSIGHEGTLCFFDASNGGVVTKISLVGFVPETDTVVDTAFGGRVKDVKRRDLNCYHFCVVSSSMILPYHVDPYNSALMPVKLNLSSFQKKMLTARYGPYGDFLFVGSDGGDVAVINLQYGTVVSTLHVCSNGVRDIAIIHDPSAQTQAPDSGGNFHYARFGPGSERSTAFYVGGGDGTIVGCRIEDHNNPNVAMFGTRLKLDAPIASISITDQKLSTASPLLAATMNGTVSVVDCAAANMNDRGSMMTTAGSSLQSRQKFVQSGVSTGTRVEAMTTMPLPLSSSSSQNIRRISDAISAPVTVVVPHPAAPEKFVSASRDGFLRLWDLNTYSIVGRFDTSDYKHDPSKYQCNAVGICEGLEIMLSAWSDGCVRCHDVVNYNLLWVLPNAHRTAVTSLCIANTVKYFVTGSEDGIIKVWDMRTREMKRQLLDHKQAVVSLEIFDDGKHLLSSSRDRTVIAWDLTTGTRVSFLEAHLGPITSMILCKNQCNVYTASADHTIAMWDLRQREAVRVYNYACGSDAFCTTMCRNRSETLLATGGTDQVVQLFDERTLRPLSIGYGHSNSVAYTTFTPDGRQVLSCGMDSCIMIWNVFHMDA